MIGHSKVSPVLRDMDLEIVNNFNDTYIFNFLNLPDILSENNLQRGLISI